MATEEEIKRELEAMNSPLAHMPRITAYDVPANYFEEAAIKFLDAVKEEAPPFLIAAKAMPFELHGDYFEDFATGILPKIAQLESEPYSIPEGYFEGLPTRMLKLVKEEPLIAKKAKTFSFRPKRVAVRWAAAALLVLGIGVGSYKVIYRTPDQIATGRLSKVDPELISEYAMQNIDDFDAETLETNVASGKIPSFNVKQLNEDEINQYLDESSGNDQKAN